MAAYRRVYDSHHLQADCQELGFFYLLHLMAKTVLPLQQ